MSTKTSTAGKKTTTTTKRVSKKEALTSCGTNLKPGYKYLKGGGTVKVIKKAAPKKKK